MAEFKAKLNTGGYILLENEPFKVTIDAKNRGYLGTELAGALEAAGIYPEFADPDYLVLMLTPDSDESLVRIAEALLAIPSRAAIAVAPPAPSRLIRAMSAREALLAATETIPTSGAEGRILATASVGCPPAIPIAISGERIDAATCRAFEYYGIIAITVVK
jgi:arginine/lysine/ornithine decarboxylase